MGLHESPQKILAGPNHNRYVATGDLDRSYPGIGRRAIHIHPVLAGRSVIKNYLKHSPGIYRREHILRAGCEPG